MQGKSIIIRKSRTKTLLYAFLSIALLLYFWFGQHEKAIFLYKKFPAIAIGIVVVFLGICIYYLYEYIKQKPEITLSLQGIELRGKGRHPWETIESISMELNPLNNSKADLKINLKVPQQLKFDVAELEKKPMELIELIFQYCEGHDIYYKEE